MKFFRVPFNHDEEGASQQPNKLHEYIQSQSMQDMARLASEISPQVKQIIAGNVQALLGYLPGQEFQTTVAADKGSFQNLLASAMVTGYFMHAMENRMKMESLFDEGDSTLDLNTKSESTLESDAADTGMLTRPVFGPERPPVGASDASNALNTETDSDAQMQASLQELIKSRLEEATRRKAALKKPEDLFGSLIERHLKELEGLEGVERLSELSPEALLRRLKGTDQVEETAVHSQTARAEDTVKIQLEINTEMGQKALTDLFRALGTMGKHTDQ